MPCVRAFHVDDTQICTKRCLKLSRRSRDVYLARSFRLCQQFLFVSDALYSSHDRPEFGLDQVPILWIDVSKAEACIYSM